MIDVAHFKGTYKGIMLVVVSIDANQQVYPIAFGLGDKKNDESRTWFMTSLRTTVGCSYMIAIS